MFRSTNARALDKIRKGFSKILGELGLKITDRPLESEIVNYLDVTLDLSTGK